MKWNHVIWQATTVNDKSQTNIYISLYLPSDFKTLYESEDDAIFFPFSLNHQKFYELKEFPKTYIRDIDDGKEIRQKKEEFHSQFLNSSKTLGELLSEYLKTELESLSKICLKIEETAIAFQNCLRKSRKQKKLPIISIFSENTHTAFFYSILTNYALKIVEKDDIYTLMNPEKGVYSSNCTRKQFVYEMYTKVSWFVEFWLSYPKLV